LEYHDKRHADNKADNGLYQNIGDVNKSECFYGIVEKYMCEQQDGSVLRKPTYAHHFHGWTICHVVAAPWFQDPQDKGTDKPREHSSTGMNTQGIVKKINGDACHKTKEYNQGSWGAQGQQQDEKWENDNMQVGEALPAHADILEDKALQQHQAHKPYNIGKNGVIHLRSSRIPPIAPAPA
jgi:hypothetical protein